MKPIFESAGTSLHDATPELARWITAQVALIATHCAADERPHLAAYRCGHEYLACDYPSLPLTIRIDAAAKPPGSEALDQNIAVSDMTDALTLISLIEGARQGKREPAITLGTYLPGSCVQQPVAAVMTERTVTMKAIRMLAQTSEALCFEMEMGNAEAVDRRILPMARMCLDHAEHIAQYDIEGLDLETRMRSIAESLNALRQVLANCHEVLKDTSSYVPDSAEIKSLIARAGKLGAGGR